jgi:hypothetical protein
LLALQLGERRVDRLGHRSVESPKQLQGAQQFDQGLSTLGALHSRLTNSGLGSQFGLRPVALETMARQTTAELSKHDRIGQRLIYPHRY